MKRSQPVFGLRPLAPESDALAIRLATPGNNKWGGGGKVLNFIYLRSFHSITHGVGLVVNARGLRNLIS